MLALAAVGCGRAGPTPVRAAGVVGEARSISVPNRIEGTVAGVHDGSIVLVGGRATTSSRGESGGGTLVYYNAVPSLVNQGKVVLAAGDFNLDARYGQVPY